MPPTDQERAKFRTRLLPGESFTATYNLHIFSPPLPAGSYAARIRGMTSNTLPFTIRGK